MRRKPRLLCLTLQGLPPQDVAIWVELVASGWRHHPRALPLQMVGLSMLALLISKSSLPPWIWAPIWGCMLTVCLVAILLAVRFRRVRLQSANYVRWRALLLGWRAAHGLSGGLLCALLYGSLPDAWRLPLLMTVIVFTYGLTFYAIEDLGLAIVGSAPIVVSMLLALCLTGKGADGYIAVLMVAACINGWLAGRGMSLRLFEAARTRQRNAVLVGKLACEVDEVRRAKAQLEQVSREKSEFFATASHDLRQPLYSLHLLSDHLRQQLTSAYQREVADKLDVALGAMRELFERMFDVARLEAQKVAYHPRAVSVKALFEQLDGEFALVCRKKCLHWSVQPIDDCLYTDPVLAARMLRNLLENAVRYTADGAVHLRARRRGAHIHCQVWDSGMGIGKQDQARVFDDYYQVQNTARQEHEGLGLGLGVVRRLLSLTGARITVRTRVDKGSCFSIAFQAMTGPCAQPSDQERLAAVALDDVEDAPFVGTQAGPCVLVVEDQRRVRDAVVTVLEHGGYLTLSGDRASDLVREVAMLAAWPAAVICDYRLGEGYDGFDAIAELRYEFGDALPAILVTGDLDPRIQTLASERGVELMHKPLSRVQLLGALKKVVNAAR